MTWRERCAVARGRTFFGTRRGFTAEEKEMARDWRTCGVGEHFALGTPMEFKITKDTVYGGTTPNPADAMLYSLGFGFHDAVRNDQPDRAESILDAIGQRLRVLNKPTNDAAVDRLLDEVSGGTTA